MASTLTSTLVDHSWGVNFLYFQPCLLRDWELHVHFRVHGQGSDLFGDGMALWYARDRLQLGKTLHWLIDWSVDLIDWSTGSWLPLKCMANFVHSTRELEKRLSLPVWCEYQKVFKASDLSDWQDLWSLLHPSISAPSCWPRVLHNPSKKKKKKWRLKSIHGTCNIENFFSFVSHTEYTKHCLSVSRVDFVISLQNKKKKTESRELKRSSCLFLTCAEFLGEVFGSKDFPHGLAIFLDTYSNHNGPHNVSSSSALCAFQSHCFFRLLLHAKFQELRHCNLCMSCSSLFIYLE